jgi:hypothetical protein
MSPSFKRKFYDLSSAHGLRIRETADIPFEYSSCHYRRRIYDCSSSVWTRIVNIDEVDETEKLHRFVYQGQLSCFLYRSDKTEQSKHRPYQWIMTFDGRFSWILCSLCFILHTVYHHINRPTLLTGKFYLIVCVFASPFILRPLKTETHISDWLWFCD